MTLHQMTTPLSAQWAAVARIHVVEAFLWCDELRQGRPDRIAWLLRHGIMPVRHKLDRAPWPRSRKLKMG
jgi:hypothetical protein